MDAKTARFGGEGNPEGTQIAEGKTRRLPLCYGCGYLTEGPVYCAVCEERGPDGPADHVVHYDWAQDARPDCALQGQCTATLRDVTCASCQSAIVKVVGRWSRDRRQGDEC